MKGHYIASMLAVLCATPVKADESWYVGHLRADECVPLTDIGDNLERLYYGSGNISTPQQFIQFMRRKGVALALKFDKTDEQHGRIILYRVTNFNKNNPADFDLYNKKETCQLINAKMEK